MTTKITADHRREIGNDFHEGFYFDACSCGWESESRSPVLADVQRDDTAWRAHVATAKPCAHDTIAEAAGIRVCLDCGAPDPNRESA